jgi:hypothetical protein
MKSLALSKYHMKGLSSGKEGPRAGAIPGC